MGYKSSWDLGSLLEVSPKSLRIMAEYAPRPSCHRFEVEASDWGPYPLLPSM